MSKMSNETLNETDHYILAQPEHIQPLLRQMRDIIQKAAPKAEETISYAMPAWRYHGMLVYFAAAKNHIGFYPTPSAITAFEPDIQQYVYAKGSVQFPLDRPLPAALITRIVKFRVKENEEKAALKKKK